MSFINSNVEYVEMFIYGSVMEVLLVLYRKTTEDDQTVNVPMVESSTEFVNIMTESV